MDVAGSLRARFVGTWNLVSWKIERPDGEVRDYLLGPSTVGRIMYHPDGNMCAMLMRPDRPKLASNNVMGGHPKRLRPPSKASPPTEGPTC